MKFEEAINIITEEKDFDDYNKKYFFYSTR